MLSRMPIENQRLMEEAEAKRQTEMEAVGSQFGATLEGVTKERDFYKNKMKELVQVPKCVDETDPGVCRQRRVGSSAASSSTEHSTVRRLTELVPLTVLQPGLLTTPVPLRGQRPGPPTHVSFQARKQPPPLRDCGLGRRHLVTTAQGDHEAQRRRQRGEAAGA